MATVLAVDVGTTRVKACALSQEATLGALASAPAPVKAPQPGAVEVDAQALWETVLAVLREAAAAGPPAEALAIANQRATVLVTDDAGAPLAPGLSWQDTRGGEALSAWLDAVGRQAFAQATGLAPSVVWSLAKILWWREQGLPRGARFATVQDWLLRRLGARDWVLDHANASLTGLMNIHSLDWDERLLQTAGLRAAQLPALAPSGTPVGQLDSAVAAATGLAAGTPLILGGGDQQCAALGAGALEPGATSLTMGTAGAVSTALARATIDPQSRLVCLAHVIPGRWTLEGLQDAYGAALRWGSDLLGQDLTGLAADAPIGSRGLVCLPYLAGSGAPDHDSQARAAILGLTLAHGRSDVARAVLEGATVELVRILAAVQTLAPVGRLVANGGGARMGLLLEMLAGLAGTPVQVAAQVESSLVGAGLLAWVGLGRWPDALTAGASLPAPPQTVAPDSEQAAAYHDLYGRYLGALDSLRRGGLLRPAGVHCG